MTTTEVAPPRGRRRGATGKAGWGVQYRYARLLPGMTWHRDESEARHWAGVYRRYGAGVRILERSGDGRDTWHLLHPDGQRLVLLHGTP